MVIQLLIYFGFFIIFCVAVRLEYLSFLRKRNAIRQSKQNTIDTLDAYKKNNQTDVAHVSKEMHQRIKKRQLDDALNEAYRKKNATDDDAQS